MLESANAIVLRIFGSKVEWQGLTALLCSGLDCWWMHPPLLCVMLTIWRGVLLVVSFCAFKCPSCEVPWPKWLVVLGHAFGHCLLNELLQSIGVATTRDLCLRYLSVSAIGRRHEMSCWQDLDIDDRENPVVVMVVVDLSGDRFLDDLMRIHVPHLMRDSGSPLDIHMSLLGIAEVHVVVGIYWGVGLHHILASAVSLVFDPRPLLVVDRRNLRRGRFR